MTACLPEYTTFHRWASVFMADRGVSYINPPTDEKQWADWARAMTKTEDVPLPTGYATWREWAYATLATA